MHNIAIILKQRREKFEINERTNKPQSKNQKQRNQNIQQII